MLLYTCKRHLGALLVALLMLLWATPAGAQSYYTISYHPNGGAGYMPDTIVASGTLFILPPCTYTREGYDFIGWSVDTATSDSSLIRYRANAQVHIYITTQFSLYAVWRSNCTNQYDSIATSSCNSYVWYATGDTLYHNAIMRDTAFGVVPGECDSIYFLDLAIYPTYDSVTVLHGCDSLWWNNNWFYSSAQSTLHYNSVDGCDSVLSLHLTIDYAFRNTTTTSVCDSFYWSATGLYYYHDTVDVLNANTVNGCDSVVFNHIFIHPSFLFDTVAVVCDSFYWAVSDALYHNDTNVVKSMKTPFFCDSVYSLQLSINRSYSLLDTVVGCDSLLWSGSLETGGGMVSLVRTADTNVVQYLSTASGCDSTVSLLLHVGNSYFQTDVHTVCDSFFWVAGAQNFSRDTSLVVSYATADGCDSSFALQLTVGHTLLCRDSIVACDSFYWAAGQETYYTGACDTAAYSSSLGCDSTFMLHLVVNHSYSHSDTIGHCDSYTWPANGITYTADTVTLLSLATSAGCDSVHSLLLDIWPAYHINETASACDSVFCNFTGLTYHASTFINEVGFTESGCDSTIHISLTVNPSFRQVITPVVCDDFYWTVNATQYSSSQYVELSNSTVHGCDSSYVLDLTVHHSREADVCEVACDSLFCTATNRFYYTDTDEDVNTFTTAGCDSLIHLHVTINTTSYTVLFDTICDGGDCLFNGQTYQDAGVYYYRSRTSAGCDSTIELRLSVWDRPYISYEVDYDCPSGYYFIHSHSSAPYYRWSADPADPSLDGQEHSAYIEVKPTRDTRYSLFSDYYATPTCGDSIDLILKPVVNPTARLEVSPETLDNDNLRFHAIDRSHNASQRAWYVDGQYVTGDPDLWYTASMDADSVVLMLEASTPTCYDTVWHTLLMRRDLLFFPNAFTPDESTNNTFFGQGSGVLEYEIHIYNRSGHLVFCSNDFAAQWNGTDSKGKPCPQGVYVYMVKYVGATMPDTPQVRTGNVLLIR